MTTTTPSDTGLGSVLTLSQLASQLGVGVQTLYDLRSQGRGPRGFRVGRELRLRVSEIDAWLAQLEEHRRQPHCRPRQRGPIPDLEQKSAEQPSAAG